VSKAEVHRQPQLRLERTSSTAEALVLSIEGPRALSLCRDLVPRAARRTADRERPDLGEARKAIERVLVVSGC
jgi:hypothetical protein